MITFIIGLLIGGFFGVMFTSMLVLRRREPQCLGQKDTIVWPDKNKEKDVVFPMPKWKDRKI